MSGLGLGLEQALWGGARRPGGMVWNGVALMGRGMAGYCIDGAVKACLVCLVCWYAISMDGARGVSGMGIAILGLGLGWGRKRVSKEMGGLGVVA